MKTKTVYTRRGEEIIVEDYEEERSFCEVCGRPIPRKRGVRLCRACFIKSKINGGRLIQI